MALNYIEAKNGYPIALLRSDGFPNPRPSEGTHLSTEYPKIYSDFAKNIVSSKNARKKRRTVLTINTGSRMLSSVAESLDFNNGDLLYVIEQQSQRTETATTLAERLRLNPESLVIGRGNFLVSPYSEITELLGNRLDFIIFGYGSPSLDRTRKDGSCRIQAEINKAGEILREGGSLIMAPPLLYSACIEDALRGNHFQLDPEKSALTLGASKAIRAIALR